MKKIVGVFIVGVLFFSVSAAGSWFLHQKQLQLSEGDETPTTATFKPGKSIKPFAPADSEGAPAKVLLRPALRAPHNPQTESVLQMANNLRNQTEALKTREQQIAVRQRHIELIHQDLRKERETIGTLQKQINDEMKVLQDRMSLLEQKNNEVKQERESITSQKKEMSKSLMEFDSVEQTRIKQMASIYDTMEADKAVPILTQMVDTGRMDTAVKILASMRERQAARVLGLMPETMAAQLMDKLKGLKRPTATP